MAAALLGMLGAGHAEGRTPRPPRASPGMLGPGGEGSSPPDEPAEPSVGAPVSSLRERIGVERGKELLLAGDAGQRLQGIERLATDGGEEAVAALVEALQPGSAVLTSPQSRLAAVRALAPHALAEEARLCLERMLQDEGIGAPESPLDELVRGTAAVALARAGAGLLPPPAKPAGADEHAKTKPPADDEDHDEEGKNEAGRGGKGPGGDDEEKGEPGEREDGGKHPVKPERPEDLAITPLVASVIVGTPGSRVAREALLAFPPGSLRPLLLGRQGLSPRVIALLGDLGDARAIGPLRKQLDRKHRGARLAAVVALAKLGDGLAARHARAWTKAPATDTEVQLAAAEALMWLDADDAPAVLAKLLAAASSRPRALELAGQLLSPALVPTLAAVVDAPVSAAERQRAATVIARTGGPKAASALLRMLARPELATLAAFGLGRDGSPASRTALGQALAAATAGAPRRLVVRAALVRFLAHAERLDGLEEALAGAYGSSDPSDRAVGGFGLALLGRRTVTELVGSGKPELLVAGARAALVLGPSAIGALEPLLLARAATTANGPEQPGAALAALALFGEAPEVASSTLADWADAGGPLAALAAYRLAVRDARAFRPRLAALLGGTDPLVRLHVVLGLGQSPEADAATLLGKAYRFEADVRVRRAAVWALSLRPEKLREPTLRLAAELDPDPAVRGAARAALGGVRHPLVLPPAGPATAWVALLANDTAARARLGGRVAELVRPDGLSLPVASDPDGVLLVPGLRDDGAVELRLDR